MIRAATLNDAEQIASIYNHYVLNTTVTFEEEAVPVPEMRARMNEILEKYPWLVFEENNKVIGYAYASPWKSRCAYRYSAEISVYLEHGTGGRGIGTKLYGELIKNLKTTNLHGIIGGIALPNEPCVKLHEHFKFSQVAHFREVGHKFNKWIDVVYYELILDNTQL